MGQKLRQIASPGSFVVLLIQEQDNGCFDVPCGDTLFKNGDRLVMLTYSKDVKATLETFGVGN